MKLIANELAWIVMQSKWLVSEHRTWIAMCFAESAGDTEAIGYNEPLPIPSPLTATWGSADCGLSQINNHFHARNKIIRLNLNWRNPYHNCELARLVWLENGGPFKPETPDAKHGWTAWSTVKAGTHAKFLPRADIGLRDPFPPGVWP